MEVLFHFVFFYPLFMAYFWIMGALLFFFRFERGRREPPALPEYPPVAVLIPCHNEGNVIAATIRKVAANRYPNFEIVAINDGSTDETGAVLDDLIAEIPKLRVVHITQNRGKAMALRAGAQLSAAELLMCIDADTLLDEQAILWMVPHFLDGPRVGAVTGNPRILNRRTLLSRIQIGEFSAIIGMVKRSQRDVGRIFTVSGCHVCYRSRALHEVGYWSPETVTEDIDISWKMQLNYWDVRFEPRALAWIAVPETVRHLWRQRVRWARGGFEAAFKYGSMLKHWTKRRMWPVIVEYAIGSVWAYAWAATVVLWVCTWVFGAAWPAELRVPTLLPQWTGVVLAVTCLLQFVVGLYLDSHYERRIFRNLYWAIWYPAVYWMLSSFATVVAIPRALYYRGRVQHATWKSPERRLR
jgi:biofilm PGA synthesis N-glycosyltransferase PgaC